MGFAEGHPCHQVKPTWNEILSGQFSLSLELTGTDFRLKLDRVRVNLDDYEWFYCRGDGVYGRKGPAEYKDKVTVRVYI